MEVVIFVLALALMASIFGIINLMRKNEALEDYNSELEEFVLRMQSDAKEILDQLNQVDVRGSFATDDEVGVIFDGIKGIVKRLNVFLRMEE